MHFRTRYRETGFSSAPAIQTHDMPVTTPSRQGRQHRFLTQTERKELATLLISETSWGTGDPILAYGAVARAAEKIRISREAVRRFWKGMRLQYAVNGVLSGSPTKFRTGRPSIYSNIDIERAVEEIAKLGQCRSIWEMAKELGISKSSLCRMIKQKKDKDKRKQVQQASNSFVLQKDDEIGELAVAV